MNRAHLEPAGNAEIIRLPYPDETSAVIFPVEGAVAAIVQPSCRMAWSIGEQPEKAQLIFVAEPGEVFELCSAAEVRNFRAYATHSSIMGPFLAVQQFRKAGECPIY